MKDHDQRGLRPLLVPALLLAATVSVLAQTPAPAPPAETKQAAVNSSPTAPVNPGQATSAPTAASTAPNPNATPEQIGDSMMAHQRYQAAIEQYKKAPRSAEVLNKMGIAYQLLFNLDDAARCYEQSLKLNPKNSVAINNLGTVYVTLKQYSKAEKAYRKALKLQPKSALVHKNLGTALLAQHKYEKGWKEYQNALADDPEVFKNNTAVRVENPASVQDRGAMNFYMAKGCVRAGQAERAIEYLRMAINEGFTTPKKVAADEEFAGLRGIPAYEEMLAALRAQ